MEKKKKKKLLWFYVVIALMWVLVFAIMGLGDEETEPKENATKEEVQKAEFTMQSNDSIGAFGYTVGKTGKYEIVCVKGHGALIINDADLFVLANDEYVGEEYSGLIYEEKMVFELNDRDELLARAYNSSDFKLEFYLIEE